MNSFVNTLRGWAGMKHEIYYDLTLNLTNYHTIDDIEANKNKELHT